MARNRPKVRARNLEDQDIEAIVSILDGWEGKRTWELLIEIVEQRLNARYTRQALNQRVRIKQAFQLTKSRVAGLPNARSKSSLGLGATEAQALLERLERIEAENARLKVENERLLEQFVVWAYNASNRGLDAQLLSQPPPRVHRDQTKLGVVRKAAKL